MSGDAQKNLLFVLMDTPASRLGLNFTDKAVLQALVGHLNQKRNGTEVWPGNERLAELTGGSIDTIRRAKKRLHDSGLIRIRRDSGKSDVCSIDVDAIRALCDPLQNAKGQTADPSQIAGGTPSKLPGDPSQIATRIAKGTTNLNSQVPTVSHSAMLKVGDGPEQRKMPLAGIIAGAAERMRVSPQEQPTGEKPHWQEDRRAAMAKTGTRERPG